MNRKTLTGYQIEQQTFNVLEMPHEAWTSSCTGKRSQTTACPVPRQAGGNRAAHKMPEQRKK